MAYFNRRGDTQSTDPSALNPINHQGQGTPPGAGSKYQPPDWEKIYGINHNTDLPPPNQKSTPNGSPSGGGLAGYQDQYDFITNLLTGAQGRGAPQSTAVAPATLTQATGANLPAAVQAQAAAAAQAQQARASLAGPAAQAADSSFRGGQQTTADYLTRLMQGQDSAAAVQAKMQGSQLLAQQAALAASARPGQGGAAQRIAAQNQANLGAQLESSTLAAQLQERSAAAAQLSALLGTARGQDLQNNEFNADQSNQSSRLNAQLGTQTGIANAGYGTQANLANMAAMNQMNQFNSAAQNERNSQDAQLQQQNSQFNAAQGNQLGQFNAGLAQQNNQFNTGAQLQQSGLNDAFTNSLLGQRLGLQGLNQNGQQFQQSLAQQRALAMLQNDTQLTLGGKQTYQQLLGGLGGAANMLLPYLLGKGGGGGGGVQDGFGGFFTGNYGDGSTPDYQSFLDDAFGYGSGAAQLPYGYSRSPTGGIINNLATDNGGGGSLGQGGAEALKYGSTGAALGSNFGPWGTAIGAGAGALYGFFDGLF